MENELLLNSLLSAFPEAAPTQGADWPELSVEADALLPVLEHLRSNPDWDFNYLFCETCIDWKTHFTMVYHLSSTRHRHSLVLKAKVNHDKPEIETVSHWYKTAVFMEREVYDLFGVVFLNHPDLRRLLLTEDWKGYPLRKDYEDPVNMIKL